MRLQVLFLALVAAVVMAGCGGEGSGADAGADPASVMPASALIYFEGVVRPEGEQRDKVEDFVGHFVAGDDPFGQLEQLAEEELAAEGEEYTYAGDIEPWLGQRAGVAITGSLESEDPEMIAATAVTDKGAAEDFIDKVTDGARERSVGGVSYSFVPDDDLAIGLVGDFLVATVTEADFAKAVEAHDGSNLSDAERYKDAIVELPEDRLGSFYFDLRSFTEAFKDDPELGEQEAAIISKLFGDGPPITGALTADSDTVTIESRFPSSFGSALGLYGVGEAPDLLAEMPDDAWVAYGVADVGTVVQETLTVFGGALGGATITGAFEAETGLKLQADLLDWIGDAVLFVRGTTIPSLSGAVVIEVKDADKARAAVPRIVEALTGVGVPLSETTLAGADLAYEAAVPDFPQPVELALSGDRLVIAAGKDAAADGLDPAQTIGDSGLYHDAEDALDGIKPQILVDAPAALELIASSAPGDEDLAKAMPYLRALVLFAVGAEKDGDELLSRYVVKAG
jgi:hypothetical protein